MYRLRPAKIPAPLNGTALKIIAVLSMVIDHVGLVLFYGYGIYKPMRIVGRLAFPIFCFLLVEGAAKTKSMANYAARLFVFAVFAEVPFDLAIYGTVFYPEYQNTLFTLFFGLLMLWIIKKTKSNILMLLGVIACGLAAYFLKTDYGAWGIALILSIYVATVVPPAGTALFIALMIFKGGLEAWGAAALIPMFFYNGRRGPQIKYLFYAFYPAHLLLIFLAGRYFM